MLNHRSARKNMVDCQLNTNGIIHPRILQLFSALPREIFLPEGQGSRAYVDDDLVLPDGKVLLEPLVHARMLQALAPRPDEVALIIGDTTGYASAILCGLVSTVLAVEERPGIFDRARRVWSDIGANNIAVVPGQNAMGCPEHAPYALIVLHGAVTHVPDHLLDQLAPGGRMVAVIRPPGAPVGRITLLSRDGDNNFSVATLQDATSPYIAGFVPPVLFKFG
jgi:protein-L-isoaspartate(D-aspartate) O-methyltransferase